MHEVNVPILFRKFKHKFSQDKLDENFLKSAADKVHKQRSSSCKTLNHDVTFLFKNFVVRNSTF